MARLTARVVAFTDFVVSGRDIYAVEYPKRT